MAFSSLTAEDDRKMAVKKDFAQDHFRWEKRAFHHLLLVLQCFRALHSPNPIKHSVSWKQL